MITHQDTTPGEGHEFREHMAALERLRKELETGELDPVTALAICREAELHYRAVITILTRVERELEEMELRSE